MGIASLVVSIIAIILSIIPVVGLPIALIALILAIIAMCRKKNKEVYRGFKIAGLVISIISFVISILFTAPILIGAYIVSKNSQDIISRSEDAVLASNVAELKSAVALEYTNQYSAWVAYKSGQETTAVDEPSLATITTDQVKDILAEVNSNSLGIKYEISWIEGIGPTVQEVGSSVVEGNKENKDDNQQVGNETEQPKEEESKEEEQEKEPEKEVEKIDPYKNYKNMKWAGTSVGNLKIENGVVYNYNLSKKTKVTGITGTPKKLLSVESGGTLLIYILSDNGKIFYLDWLDAKAEKVCDITKYNIVDMTHINNYTNENLYYLTADGKLIDKNGVSYNKYSFVDEFWFNGRTIPIDKNGYGYYYNEKTNTYVAIANKANKVKLAMSKIYVLSDDSVLIVTTGNRAFKYDETSYLVPMEGTVKSINKETKGNINLVVTYDNGTVKKYEGLQEIYDVKTKKYVEITSLSEYQPPKVEVPETSNNFEEIYDSFKKQIINTYDGKTMRGTDILALVNTYWKSNGLAIAVTVNGNTYYFGIGNVKLPSGIDEDSYKAGGIKGATLVADFANLYSEAVDVIKATDTYKTAILYDSNEDFIGIAAIKITK